MSVDEDVFGYQYYKREKAFHYAYMFHQRSSVTIVPGCQLYYVGGHEPFELNFCRSIDVELDIDFGHCAQLCEASAPLLAYLINTIGCSPGHCLTGSSPGAEFVVISRRVAHFVVLWSSVHANQE